MTKEEIRKLYKEKRKNLYKDTCQELNSKIKHYFFENLDLNSVRIVHTYLPIVAKNEVDTLSILSHLKFLKPDVSIQIPFMKDGHMFSVKYLEEDGFVTNINGIIEPIHPQFEENTPDLVITPLLAFDQKGYRVGYGGGYYDRFFAQLPANVQKVGLSFFNSVEIIDDLDEFDIPLDSCVTPNGFIDFEFSY